ncbi:MAG: sll1863 family stress response protein [Thermoanaerobaculia bacterium]
MTELEPKPADKKSLSSLREWGFDVETFRAKAKTSLESARGDLSEVKSVLRQALAETRQTLIDLQQSRKPVAAELRNAFERAWSEIENGFAQARQKMRESREASKSGDDSATRG